MVVAPDRPGLLSDVTGALALHDIGVLEARVHSEAGHALEVFTLDLPEHADPRWDRVEADITAAVEKRLNIGELLARRPPDRRSRRLMALPAPGVRVIVDNEAATKRHRRRSQGARRPWGVAQDNGRHRRPGPGHRLGPGGDARQRRGGQFLRSFGGRQAGRRRGGGQTCGAALERALGEPRPAGTRNTAET